MKIFIILFIAIFTMHSCSSVQKPQLTITHQGDSLTILKIENPTRYIIFPIQESCRENGVKLYTGQPTDVMMGMRLATDSIDYYVPFELPQVKSKEVYIHIAKATEKEFCWKNIQLSDSFKIDNTDYYRPLYHHTPLYGWMNDPNGLVFKDGEYHLYYQYNPYGSKWGNMHWGHSVSKDLVNWEQQTPVLAKDTMGFIFSGSAVVDHTNSAGYGKDAIIAFYTSAGRLGQVQCLAYSNDNGYSYTKYENNPVLTPFDNLRDFRDPKVFWYAPANKWYMIVSADKEMRFYNSSNLKDWEYLSGFGKGYGQQPNQFECPDFIQLPVDGDPNKTKWMMIVNINPGCIFGGSATEYFIGDFDGKEFKCDTQPNVTKWLDWGKDHYATVCFSNTGTRSIAVPWMSNWQYANLTPFKQHRGANGLPRELSLFEKDGQIYAAANVIPEIKQLRKQSREIEDIQVKQNYTIESILPDNEGAYEIEMDITPGKSNISGIILKNGVNEQTKIYLDLQKQCLIMDRTESGIVDFGEKTFPSKKEGDFYKKQAINYQNDFALGTYAPLTLCNGKTYHLDIFVDKCSVEIFVDGGRIAMTNLIFPSEPYNTLQLYSEKDETLFSNLKIHKLEL